MLALRTLTIDGHVREAIEQGVRQLVVLGAGFDGRAFRMNELADVDTYEGDHPSTQAKKRRRSAGLRRKSKSLAFVQVDFETQSAGAALEAAGHRKNERTVWVWEGGVMYLPRLDESRRGRIILARR